MVTDPIPKTDYDERQKKQLKLGIKRASKVFNLSSDGEVVKRLGKKLGDEEIAYFLRREVLTGIVHILKLRVSEKPTSEEDAKSKLQEIIGETDPDFTKLVESGEVRVEPEKHNGEPVIQISRILRAEDDDVS